MPPLMTMRRRPTACPAGRWKPIVGRPIGRRIAASPPLKQHLQINDAQHDRSQRAQRIDERQGGPRSSAAAAAPTANAPNAAPDIYNPGTAISAFRRWIQYYLKFVSN